MNQQNFFTSLPPRLFQPSPGTHHLVASQPLKSNCLTKAIDLTSSIRPTMDPPNTASFGRSSSMALIPWELAQELTQELDQESERQEQYASALREIENSMHYHLMVANESPQSHSRVGSADGPITLPSLMSLDKDCEEQSSTSSPDSDKTVTPASKSTVRPQNSEGGRTGAASSSNSASTRGSSRSVPEDVAPQYAAGHQYNYPSSVFSSPAPTFMPTTIRLTGNILPKSSSEPLLGYNSSAPELGYMNAWQSPASPSLRQTPYISGTLGRGGIPQHSIKSADRLASTPTPAPTPMGTTTQDAYTPPSNMHQRKPSNRNSAIPPMPSRLGPGHPRNDLGPDTSRLVSSPSTSSMTPQRHLRDQSWRQGGLTARYGQPVGMMNTASSTPRKPGEWNTTHTHTHTRYPSDSNDPFIERRPASLVPPRATPTPAPTPISMQTDGRVGPSTQPPVTPSPAKSRFFAHPRGVPSTHPTSTGYGPQHEDTPTTTKTPAPTSSSTPTQDAPIPPVPLTNPCLATRQSWILHTASHIASCSRAHLHVKTQYALHPSPENLETLHHTQTALKEATDLEKRVEARRNLFMPGGMRALRTGFGAGVGDGFAGGYVGEGGTGTATTGTADGGGCGGGEEAETEVETQTQTQGRLLGGYMAFLERVCAEGMRRDGEQGAARTGHVDVTDMSEAEKRAVRRYFVGGIEEAMERRVEGARMQAQA
ncbi:hypothetical protein K458DRAFT_199805 [Lentithecium fluviatile CBS 122367]|uniref:Uncharacterized protein n=1 Tax=Lentithecium fluviatile CBS 122367 TaxID=1168545 RepID=A0A6G1J835_9PLEO|nr:hypothetical protein K458DRAFT_199805 [Lentithecium fluviatile CBS 122367]